MWGWAIKTHALHLQLPGKYEDMDEDALCIAETELTQSLAYGTH